MLNEKKPREAVVALNRSMKENPRNSDAYALAAIAVMQSESDYDLAISLAQKAIEINPNELRHKETLSIAYANKAEYEKCVELYKEIISKTKDSQKISEYKEKMATAQELIKHKNT